MDGSGVPLENGTASELLPTDKKELFRRMLNIALPMVVSQASETVMLFVDRLFLSRLGTAYLSAAMSGGLTSFVLASIFGGTVGYVNAIVAQYYGAGRKDRCASAVTQGIYLSFAAYPFLLAVIPLVKYFFVAVGHNELQISLEYGYFRVLFAGSLLFVLRSCVTGFFLGIGRTRIVMAANIVGMLVNIPVNYVLIFGKLGFPAMAMEGAAIGTICGNAAIISILMFVYLRKKYRQEYGTGSSWRFDKRLFRKLIKFGSPAGIEMFLNVMAFNIFVQLMHSYGPGVAAAVTITFNWDMVAFIPMLGLGFATTAVAGQYVGARDMEGARETAYMSLKIGYIYAGTMMMVFLFGAGPLVAVFSSGFPDATPEIEALARMLLRLASLYTLADATQLIFAGTLRGAGDTAWVMRLSVILHWLMAISAIVLIRIIVVPPVVVWLVFILLIICMGVGMILRFRGGKWTQLSLVEDAI